MKSLPVLFLALCVALAAGLAPRVAQAVAADPAHSSQNSLDWAGAYEGVLACADCPGIKTRLVLRKDGSYELRSVYLERSVAPRIERGSFAWQPGGNAIKLDAAGGNQLIAVGEGRVAWLAPDATPSWPQPEHYVLRKVAQQAQPKSNAKSSANADLRRKLESYRWTLDAATDAQGQPIAGLPAAAQHPVVLQFGNGKLAVEGGCNRSFGGYRIEADGRLHVGRMASTMMACEPAAMKVDADLATLLAEPVAIEFTAGDPAKLRLVSPAAGALAFSGTLTPEARYGKATRVFLEVAAQPVACAPGGAPECLSVREIAFDNKGLRVGTPGAWQPRSAPIEGYTHQSGVRNVLRIKRFTDKATGTTHDVLDIVVESETVAR